MIKNALLYALTVMIWGSTWLAIEYQLGEVPVLVSLVYRFGLATMLVLMTSYLMGLNLRFSARQHRWFVLLGILNFGINYWLMYQAQIYLTSAMTSVAFSLLLLLNIINTRLFFNKPIAPRTYLGALVGIAGLVVLFWPELTKEHAFAGSLTGLLLVIAGAASASFGNMVSLRNSNEGLPVLQTTGWAMLYGTLFLFIAVLIRGEEFVISQKPEYWYSFAYLTVFGTVIAFYSYFVLLKNIGPEKTSYSIVLFPLVAVVLSVMYEGLVIDAHLVAGFILIIGGNLLVLIPKGMFRARFLTKIKNEKFA